MHRATARLWDYVEVFADVLGERSTVYSEKAIHRREKCSRWIHVNNWNSGVIFDEYKYYQYQNLCIEQEQDFWTVPQKYLQMSGGGQFNFSKKKLIST